MKREDAIHAAAEQLSNCDNFILVAVKGSDIDTTTFIDNASSALGILSTIKNIEHSILTPQPSKSRIV